MSTTEFSGLLRSIREPAVQRSDDRERLAWRYDAVRAVSETICRPLRVEDYVIQTMPDVSPTKWHLAHVSWLYERFILRDHTPGGYEPYRPAYDYLFNSYYNAIGPQHCRPNRGLISRPTVAEVYEYRSVIDERMRSLIETVDEERLAAIALLVEIGLQHEQQHQELILTDLKHVFSTNPLLPAYVKEPSVSAGAPPSPHAWRNFDEGVRVIGAAPPVPEAPFVFDNETPRHRVFLEPYALASRPVTNHEYAQFVADGGYERPELWLSLGWATVTSAQWRHPIYWYRGGDDEPWMQYTLSGPRPLDPAEPVCHVSFFEADAFARWAGARLPTEAEWEAAAATQTLAGHFGDQRRFHPRRVEADEAGEGLAQLFGDVWEWTSSAYDAYPGFRALPGALGEYNGKFMCNQYVLRGGSCATPAGHVRQTYRNFFPPEARWQFAGIRLARGA